VQQAHVVLEGNRPGVMDRLGLSWQELRRLRPALVMCSINGYGAEGELAARAGHDLNYMALTGALSLNGTPAAPVPYGLQVADFGGGGMGGALAVVAALFEAGKTGRGRHLDVSMAAGVLGWLAPQLAQAKLEGDPERGRQSLTGRYPCYRVYECADGRFYSVAALEPKFWSELCALLARPDLEPMQFDDSRQAHVELEGLFRGRTRDEWEAALSGRDVCAEPVLTVAEALSRAPVREHVREQAAGLEMAPQVGFGEHWRRLPPPKLGEHTAEVLAEIGISEDEIGRLRAEAVV
jgi:crotonobetainyl-CoA:carnitine CoA-transferase CaiB-like acyl-CoA transferase